jgi:ribonucleoside-diphosphate reductase alpha chain
MAIVLSENAQLVLQNRYLMRDATATVIETPEALFRRVARHVATAEHEFGDTALAGKTEAAFFQMMANLEFLPNSPTLMNAGKPLGQLAACFVLPIEDDMQSIFDAVKHTALIHKSGGGTGFSFSRIRPSNDTVSTTAGVSSGPLSFMTVFDVATEAVKQGGTRRGANMGVLRIDHPDIEAFITAKNNHSRLNNFNISVAVDQNFMNALEGESEYDLINPRTGEAVKRLPARNVFDLIVQSAWQSGEPGMIFLDRINQANPTPQLGAIEATNPCGEQPLLAYESCTLGSINLARMVSAKGISYARLKRTIHTAVHFLDNVIEVNQYPLPQIATMSRATRKIGLGIMGFHDLLIRLGIAYDSEEALQHADSIMSFIRREARRASSDLARRRGNFPAYQGSLFDDPATPFMRNATVTTIAPTGTIGLIAGVSSGIEPLFAIAHARHVLDGRTLSEIHPLFVRMARKEGFFSTELLQEVLKRGSVQGLDTVPAPIQRLFRTAHDISPKWHIRVQAAFQKHTDNAVSKTVNFPGEASPQDVADVFLSAARSGCKGVTIYRYGSRLHQVLNLGGTGREREQIAPRPRPQRTHGLTERIATGCGRLYVTINSDQQGVCEVFAQMGKTGGCASSQIEAAGRLISLALRSGVQVDAIIKQLKGIRCPSPVWQNGKIVLSCPDAMAQVLQNVAISDQEALPLPAMGACPECSSVLVHEEGCLVCRICGFSKCS